MKKYVAIILAVAILVGILCGCESGSLVAIPNTDVVLRFLSLPGAIVVISGLMKLTDSTVKWVIRL